MLMMLRQLVLAGTSILLHSWPTQCKNGLGEPLYLIKPETYFILGVDIGQLYVIDPVFSIDYGWLDTIFLSHHFLVVKQFLI